MGSGYAERVLQVAGSIRGVPKSRWHCREAFGGCRNLADIVGKHSGVAETSLTLSGSIRGVPKGSRRVAGRFFSLIVLCLETKNQSSRKNYACALHSPYLKWLLGKHSLPNRYIWACGQGLILSSFFFLLFSKKLYHYKGFFFFYSSHCKWKRATHKTICQLAGV